MMEEKILDVMGQIDPKYVAAAQRYRGKAASPKSQEYKAEPVRHKRPPYWLIPAACALTVLALALVIPQIYQGSTTGTHIPPTATDPFFAVQAEPTKPLDEPPPIDPTIIERAPYEVVIDSVDAYWALRETADLPEDSLAQFLQKGNYSGIDTRDRLNDFLEDTQTLPIPELPGHPITEIRIKEYVRSATFAFSDFTMQVDKIPDRKYTEATTQQMSLIRDYEGYPLYMGAESILNGIVHLDLYMNAEGYLVKISAKTDNSKTFVDSLEGLSFQFPESAEAVSIYSGETEHIKWVFDEESGVLTFTPLRENAHVTGYMLSTESPWYKHADKITTIVLQDGIIGLDHRSITQLPNLQSISLPDSLLTIGDSVFAGCAIHNLHIPAAVTDIGTGVAADCPKLQEVVISAWQPHIGSAFLKNCPTLEIITIKSTTGYWQQVVVPANPHLLDVPVNCAMEADYDLAALYDENGVRWSYQESDGSLSIVGTGMVGSAPAGILPVWDQIQTVVVSEGITAMKDGLSDMTALRSVSLPSTLETMISFFGCKNLESITVPDRIQELPSSVFHGCTSLKTVILPDGLIKIQSMAFGGCSALAYISIPDSVNWIDDVAFWECISLTEIRLPDSLRRLKSGTFQNCTQLSTVILPQNLVDIEANCFDGCSTLRVLKHPGTQAELDALYDRCADAIPEGVTLEPTTQPQSTPTETQNGFLWLWPWLLIPVAAVIAVVISITVIKKKK